MVEYGLERRREADELAARGAGAPTGPDTAGPAQTITAADVQFSLAAAALYHRSRVAWFATLHRVSLFLTVLASTGAVFALTQNDLFLARAVTLIVAVISTAGLAFDFAGSARRHDDCRKTCHDLAARLLLDASSAAECQAQLIRAAATEPTTFEAASKVAFNQAILSLGRDRSAEFILKRRHLLLRHCWPFTGSTFVQRKDLA